MHLGDGNVTVPAVVGTVRVGTNPAREGMRVAAELDLGPWEAVVIERG